MYIKTITAFVALFLASLIVYPVAARAAPLSVPPGSTVELIAPAEKDMKQDDNTLRVFGYKIKVKPSTDFLGISKRTVDRFTVEKGQWLEIRARTDKRGRLVAETVRKLDEGRYFVMVRTDEVDTEVFPGGKNTRRQPIQNFLQDEAKGAAFSLRPWPYLWFGGRIEQDFRIDDERDLNSEKLGDQSQSRTELRLDALIRFGESGGFVLGESKLQFRAVSDEEDGASNKTTVEMTRTYLFAPFLGVVGLQLGRQDFDDEREWLYEELLDGARLLVTTERFHGEVAAAQGRSFLTEAKRLEGVSFAIADLRWYTSKNRFIGAWFLARSDSNPDNFSPVLFGFRALGRNRTQLRYWLDVARAQGQSGDQDIDGTAIDVGAAWIYPGMPRPYFFAGVAYGSGVEGDDQSAAFRQSGLQGNDDKVGGIASYAYYGEAFDPELSNRVIGTLGVGIRPSPAFSLDGVLHLYRQAQLSKDLGETRIKGKLTGDSTDLGTALDVVAAVHVKGLKFEAVASRFHPGDAFRERDPSHFFSFSVNYRF